MNDASTSQHQAEQNPGYDMGDTMSDRPNNMDALAQDLDEPEPGPPPALDWDTAHGLTGRVGHETALILSLSMISEQLNYIAQRMTT